MASNLQRRQVDSNAPSATITRRGFFRRAGVPAAGGLLLNGLLTGAAGAEDQKPQDDGTKEHADAKKAKLKAGPHRPTCVAIFPTADGAVVTSDDDGNLITYAFGTKAQVSEFRKQHDGKASFVAVASKVPMAITGGYDGKVVVRDPFGGGPVTVLDTHHGSSEPEVWVAILNDNATCALLGTNDGEMQLWNVAEKRKVWSFKYSADPVAGLALLPSPAGNTRFLSTHSQGVINQWEVPDNAPLIQPTPVRTFSHDTDFHVNAVAVSKDAKTFVSGSFDSTVRVWSLEGSGNLPQPVHTLEGHNKLVWRVAISPNRQRAASASQDGTVKVWNIVDGTQFKSFTVGKFGSMGVAFAGDDAIAFTGDGTDPAKAINFEKF